ncbi:tRNA lysidine(34) synthetase TilS [bacterium]|nr:tRNA lysidine(34) synthetase TilS [bacterium]
MREIVKNFIKIHNLENKKILVGFSGGADSCALLNCLNSLKTELNIELIALHLNHNWRGESAKSDENFAKEFSKKLGIKFYTETLSNETPKTETIAREKRYEFFVSCAKKFNSNCVMLAHNKNDNLETLVYRIIKGTGIEGLKAIPAIREIFYRPLLTVSREEIIEYLKENNLNWIEDNSNEDTNYNRNYIRHTLMPMFEKINPTYKNSLENLITVANNECEILDNALSNAQNQIFFEDKINTQEFLKLIYPMKLKIVYNFLKNDLKFYDLKRIKRIVDFIIEQAKEEQDPQFRKYKKFSINSKLFLYVNKKEIFKGE